MTKQKQSRVRHQVDRRSLAEEIRDSLRERIVAGEFRDGDALIQELVAEEYGASRITVREALRQLDACGLVSLETHKGQDRKSVVSGKSVSVRVDLSGRRIMKKKKINYRRIGKIRN